MCGIVGYVSSSQTDFLEEFLQRSVSSLNHRGPDSNGLWKNPTDGVGIGHTRLSIQDVSETGNQPMHSHCGRYVITFNGEIYNHLELRQTLQLKISSWAGNSDTETFLACVATWGLERALEQTVGMFALAIWDKQNKILSIARDRLGEKPLYYGNLGGNFVFASEIHIFEHYPAWRKIIDRTALASLLKYNYIATPTTIFEGIFKLEPGTFLTYDRSDDGSAVKRYWSLHQVAEESLTKRARPHTDADCLSELEQIFRDVVDNQMIADVPLGAFLSGGIDSTAVVATMQSISSQPIKTFTIGFNEKSYNEAEHAKKIAEYLGTDHTELYVSPNDALDVIPKLNNLYTEPFADSSQIPTHLISNLAHQNVKVALSGDGGDEIFGGYNRYLAMQSYWPKIKSKPIAVRNFISTCLSSIPSSTIDTAASYAGSAMGSKFQIANASDKVRKIAEIIKTDSPQAFYNQLVTHWQDAEQIVKDLNGQPCHSKVLMSKVITSDTERMILTDQMTYLPDDILVKVDRAAMGSSLETRTPFLDHRLVEFAWGLPLHMKIRNGHGKWLLRELVYKHVPRKLVDRPKAGFALPIDVWLRGPLRDWAEDLLSEQKLSEGGYFHTKPIREKWAAHLSGKFNWQHHLWSVLMFQSWLEVNQ